MVETAAVLVIFLMLLFGVFEYCRFLFIKQLVDNAAREGARFAVVSTAISSIVPDTTAVVNARMGGFNSPASVQNWTVKVYRADDSGNPVYDYQTDGTGNYVTDSKGAKNYIQFDATKGQNYVTSGASKVYFTLDTKTTSISDVNGTFAGYASSAGLTQTDSPANATFGTYIAVQIDCDYSPIVPNLLLMNSTIKIRAKAFMYSEAN